MTLSLRHADGLSRTRSFYRKVSNASMSVKKNSQCLQLIYQVVSRKCWATLTAILSIVGYFVGLVACEAALGEGGRGGGGRVTGRGLLGKGSACSHLLVFFVPSQLIKSSHFKMYCQQILLFVQLPYRFLLLALQSYFEALSF